MISERIKDVREMAELKQEEMAEILKTTQSNYSRWETGKEIIPMNKLNLLCNYFNISMDYIIGLTRNINSSGKYELNQKIIGKNLKEFRKINKLTQKDIATFLNTTQSTISAYESGKTLILTSFAYQICTKYNVSLDELCGRTTKKI